jgi:hypothetical protein
MGSDEDSFPKVVVHNRLINTITKRTGLRPPPEFRVPPGVVTWRVKPCNCRLLTVYLDKAGWHIDGRSFRVSLEEAVRRFREIYGPTLRVSHEEIEVTPENCLIGKFAKPARRVAGFYCDQPLDFDAWDLRSFEIGCDHGHGLATMSDLLSDCREFRARRAQPRYIVW